LPARALAKAANEGGFEHIGRELGRMTPVSGRRSWSIPSGIRKELGCARAT